MSYNYNLYSESFNRGSRSQCSYVDSVCSDMQFEKHLAKLAAQKASYDAYRKANERKVI